MPTRLKVKEPPVSNYTYNDIGQLVTDNYGNQGEGHRFTYNVYGKVTEVKNAANATIAHYVYDETGFRIKKVVGTTTTWYTRDASGNMLATYTTTGVNTKLEEVPIYAASRIGLARTTNGAISRYEYELTDHLGNVRATLSPDGVDAGTEIDKITGADYYPGGMEMPGRVVGTNYRFGYQGQFAEKDEETGYNQFELRLYDNRIGRWMSPDPYSQYSSPYLAMGNNWPNGIDPDGREWYTNLLGRQKWFDPGTSPKAGFFWTMNSGNGFDYRMDDGSILHNMNMGEVEIQGKIPVWRSDGTLNTKHPTYEKRQRINAREAKFWAHEAKYTGKDGLKNSLPVMGIAVATVTTGGLYAAGQLAASALIIPAIGLVNDVHEVAGSPLNETCEGMPYISTGIDALGVVVPLLDPRRAVLEAPGIIIDGVGSYQGVKQIIKDSN